LNYKSLAFFFGKNAWAVFQRLRPNHFPNFAKAFKRIFLHLNSKLRWLLATLWIAPAQGQKLSVEAFSQMPGCLQQQGVRREKRNSFTKAITDKTADKSDPKAS